MTALDACDTTEWISLEARSGVCAVVRSFDREDVLLALHTAQNPQMYRGRRSECAGGVEDGIVPDKMHGMVVDTMLQYSITRWTMCEEAYGMTWDGEAMDMSPQASTRFTVHSLCN